MKRVLLIAAFLYFLIGAAHAYAGELFYMDPGFDWNARTQITATLKKESQYAYWYMEDAYWNTLSAEEQNTITQTIENLAREFDTVIYPELTTTLGEIWSPGIDNDPKITIMLTRLVEHAGGYFNTNDEYPKKDFPTSNEREMFYINVRFVEDPITKSFIAHEFQHLITFYQKDKLRGVTEDVWLNEVRSEITPTILGYDRPYSGSNLERRVSVFLDQPSDSLIEWRNQGADYAGVNLFGQYLLDHYGKEVFHETLVTDKVGAGSINEVLRRLGYPVTFSDVFTNWTITNLVNDCEVIPRNAYCYLNPDLSYGNLHITFKDVYSAGDRITQVDSLKDWEAVWQEYAPGIGISKNVLGLDFASFAKNPVFRVPYVITRDTGKNEVMFLSLVSNESGGVSGKSYIDGFGKEVTRVVVVPSSQKNVTPQTVGSAPYTLTAELVSERPLLIIPSYSDGSLLRAAGDEKIYVIKRSTCPSEASCEGGYKRWIPSADVFGMYGHLRWENVIEVSREELDYYQESLLVQVSGREPVYEIHDGSSKHWLRMSGVDFSLSGRKWESVFIINEGERNWYYPGTDIVL